ncbi:hypothetical protein BN946_scf184826.g2 [Trametes cinnabarina]|uniref:Uncharacterized protein n=1 Tax=Pycnoporus cinnabarinus TaxID=5643 RepID=A0A060SU27_PYCCI|nr:hypothetical protein BN946_scf184826.g2 [Trametes cinnabarina]
MPAPGIKGWFPHVVHDAPHFVLKLTYNWETRETTREWVWQKGEVRDADYHLRIPKAKSTGEKFPMVPPPKKPESVEYFKLAAGANPGRTLIHGWTPEEGTRYCQHIHAYVPEHLPYKVGRLAPAQKAPLTERLLTREFWHLPFAGEDGGASDASANSAGLEIKLVPAEDGSSVLAEGLTYHQAALIPIHQAQKDLGIKYRSLTSTRPDLISLKGAQWDDELRYRAVELASPC